MRTVVHGPHDRALGIRDMVVLEVLLEREAFGAGLRLDELRDAATRTSRASPS